MVWLLFARYYTIAIERRKSRILSLRDDLSTELGTGDTVQVPWSTLFSSGAFWYVNVVCGRTRQPFYENRFI